MGHVGRVQLRHHAHVAQGKIHHPHDVREEPDAKARPDCGAVGDVTNVTQGVDIVRETNPDEFHFLVPFSLVLI